MFNSKVHFAPFSVLETDSPQLCRYFGGLVDMLLLRCLSKVFVLFSRGESEGEGGGGEAEGEGGREVEGPAPRHSGGVPAA